MIFCLIYKIEYTKRYVQIKISQYNTHDGAKCPRELLPKTGQNFLLEARIRKSLVMLMVPVIYMEFKQREGYLGVFESWTWLMRSEVFWANFQG